MSRDEAYQLLTRYIQNKNLLKHSLAAEAAMRALYRHLTPKDDQIRHRRRHLGDCGASA